MSPLVAGLVLTAPLSRDAAREAARRELSKPVYQADEPTLLERGIRAVLDFLGGLLDRIAAGAPGGLLGALLVVVILVAVAVALLVRVGPLARAGTVFPAGSLPTRRAADYRADAESCAAVGDWTGAVRARMRALVLELEDRGVLDPRPGRTATEVARDASAAVPVLAGELRDAARTFDETQYAGRAATSADDARLRAADERVRAAVPSAAGATR